jgi:hypothetical protein
MADGWMVEWLMAGWLFGWMSGCLDFELSDG